MGSFFSTPTSPDPANAMRAKQKCRGLFLQRNGLNILENRYPPTPSQYVTVFFNWADRNYNDEQLMTLVAARIRARDGIITPEPIHHDVRWCMSLRVPQHREATDTSVADCAKVVADWIRQEIVHKEVQIDRDYVFRSSHLPLWKN
ncbi:unnamed protein product [Penicillium salamii]|nr:unnamed protein product [Penicillium salamii]CAG8364704.1 unnamed protein product [Penicillium salamii]